MANGFLLTKRWCDGLSSTIDLLSTLYAVLKSYHSYWHSYPSTTAVRHARMCVLVTAYRSYIARLRSSMIGLITESARQRHAFRHVLEVAMRPMEPPSACGAGAMIVDLRETSPSALVDANLHVE